MISKLYSIIKQLFELCLIRYVKYWATEKWFWRSSQPRRSQTLVARVWELAL